MKYRHWTQVPSRIWIWHSFTPKEIASHGDGSIVIIPHALDKLQALFTAMKCEIRINDAYRDPLHNARVGGEPTSLHKRGEAFDLSTLNLDRTELFRTALEVGFTGFGLYKTFIHCDTGRARTWRGTTSSEGVSLEEYKQFFGK